jgi:hypothetical protein
MYKFIFISPSRIPSFQQQICNLLFNVNVLWESVGTSFRHARLLQIPTINSHNYKSNRQVTCILGVTMF